MSPERWWKRTKKTQGKRTSWAYCPQCRRDLNGDGDSFVDDMRSVRYTCATCGTNSEWDFNAPVPMYIGEWSK